MHAVVDLPRRPSTSPICQQTLTLRRQGGWRVRSMMSGDQPLFVHLLRLAISRYRSLADIGLYRSSVPGGLYMVDRTLPLMISGSQVWCHLVILVHDRTLVASPSSERQALTWVATWIETPPTGFQPMDVLSPVVIADWKRWLLRVRYRRTARNSSLALEVPRS